MRSSAAKAPVIALALTAIAFASTPAAIWIDVPYVKQQQNGCGAACIAMVMMYWNRGREHDKAADPEAIFQALDRPGSRGIYASQMERYFRRHGFRVFAFRGTWGDLEHHLAKGRPLIVCLGPDGHSGPLHFVVVGGLNQANQTVLVNDPARRKLLALDRARFEKSWAAEENWTLLAVPR
jgi:ABC-type bacteriocin/lantibiotic exporter with double-glycine peptidase domain